MGRSAALAFANEGAKVAIADIDEAAGAQTVRDMSGSEGEGIHIKADMGLSDDCRRVVSETVAAFGGLDIVFNNVGIQPAESYADAVDLPEETWDRIIAVNLKSRFLIAKYAIPHMAGAWRRRDYRQRQRSGTPVDARRLRIRRQ